MASIMSKVASSDPPGVSNAKMTTEKDDDHLAAGEIDCMAAEISSAVPDDTKSLTSTQRISRLCSIIIIIIIIVLLLSKYEVGDCNNIINNC
jgi:hypothetical protein